MTAAEIYADRLHQMLDEESAPEQRSIENPNVPITPTQLSDLMSYGPTRSGVQINENTALTFVAFYAAVNVLSQSVGMLPLAVFNGDDDEDVRTRAKDHPAYPLLRWSPNEQMTAVSFKETMQMHLVTWGNAYARIKYNNGGDPVALLPLLPGRTFPERKAGQLVYSVEGGGGTFYPEEIIHLPGLSLNGLTGLSPVAYCREAIGSGKATELFGAGFYGNGAAVGGVLEFPMPLKPEQMAMMKETWQAQHSGVGNAYKTGIIPFGGKYTRIGIPPNEAQFLETQKFNVTQMARMFRVPPHMIGDLDRATFSNIEQMSLEFLIYTLLIWLEKWESELTRKLCGTKGDAHVKFDDRRILRSDTAARQTYYQIGRQQGFLSANDIRRQEGMPPLPGGQGDIYLSPQNMVPADKAHPVADALVAGKAPLDGDKPQTRAAVESLRGVFVDAVGRMLRKEANAVGRGKADDEFYAAHAEHVREALSPAVRSLLSLTGRPESPAQLAGIIEFAGARHAAAPDAAVVAERLMRAIIEQTEESP